MSFGRDLQLEREHRGVSLEQLAEGTKVPSRFLYALEADDFGCLPGGVFNKGIVSSYCRHLGIAEESWLARFSASVQPNNDEHDWAVFAENVKRNRVQMGTGMRQRWWGVSAVSDQTGCAGLGGMALHVIQPGVRPLWGASRERLPVTGRCGICRNTVDADDPRLRPMSRCKEIVCRRFGPLARYLSLKERNELFRPIYVMGVTVSGACSYLILLSIRDMLRFDNSLEDALIR